ncbi:MAG: hypothetical protein LQ350_000248 [Teloschistes chrysophthalmus]|nr:MAG: hypothetical protein LQ350_000248 [Niorma chrysophthalma]
MQSPPWSARKYSPWRRKRTVLYGLMACIALYLFFKNIPPPDHPPIVRPHYPRPPQDDHHHTPPRAINDSPAHKPPPRPGKLSEAEKHYYDGPIRFYKLAVSLHAISRLRGHIEANRNVLFAASNLRSASELIPIACEMAGWDRNDVHFAFMGRDDLEMDELKLLNGVDDECNVNWHGSLVRLLKSIEAADYFNHRRPHLTIELPTEVDTPTADYLDELVWPPIDWSGAPHASQVTLRHRIPRRTFTESEASIRLVESFYPARPADSHVLVLSPQVELSPLYFHFLTFNLLEYKYSQSGLFSEVANNLVGLSLELPQTYLNESNLFTPPTAAGRVNKVGEQPPDEPTPFLWQAPSSNAALYFGDKWVEFHSFLTSRLSLDPAKAPSRPKLISESYPSWLEHLLELMRARGYALLYPNFSSGRESIASVHYELFHPPEEYSKRKPKSAAADSPVPTIDPKGETFTTELSSHHPKHPESSPLTSKLISLLPKSGAVQELFELPLLSHEGHDLDFSTFYSTARAFTTSFRRQMGQCAATKKQPEVIPMKADDLFCDHDDDKAGLGLGDLDLGGPHAMPQIIMPAVKDDSEIRQDEFEAHLKRQAGKPMEVQEDGEGPSKEEAAQDGNSDEDDVEDESEEESNGKAGQKKAEETKKKKNDAKDDTTSREEKDSGKDEDEEDVADAFSKPDIKAEKKDPKSKAEDGGKDTPKKDPDEKASIRDRGW